MVKVVDLDFRINHYLPIKFLHLGKEKIKKIKTLGG